MNLETWDATEKTVSQAVPFELGTFTCAAAGPEGGARTSARLCGAVFCLINRHRVTAWVWAWVEADVNEKENLELGRKNGSC
jgi:RNA-splicing ligase RtcB